MEKYMTLNSIMNFERFNFKINTQKENTKFVYLGNMAKVTILE